MKKTLLLFIMVCFALCATSCREDTTNLAKDEFGKYYNGKNEVAISMYSTIYFEDYKIDLNELKPNEEFNEGLIMEKDKFYFTTCEENSFFDFTLRIYESDIYGSEIRLIFSKGGYKTHPWVSGTSDLFYIEHYLETALIQQSKQIDRYSLENGSYEVVAGGNNCKLSDYTVKDETEKYKIVNDKSSDGNDKFIITNTETGEERIVDDQYLATTEYIESMEMFKYSTRRFDIVNGHILLTYSIGAGDGWNYPFLIFEYDFDTDNLEYKTLLFLRDKEWPEYFYLK